MGKRKKNKQKNREAERTLLLEQGDLTEVKYHKYELSALPRAFRNFARLVGV